MKRLGSVRQVSAGAAPSTPESASEHGAALAESVRKRMAGTDIWDTIQIASASSEAD